MDRSYVGWIALLLFGIVLIAMVAPGVANADDPPPDPGDPYEIPPGSKPLKPAPGLFSDCWMILLAMAFQFAL